MSGAALRGNAALTRAREVKAAASVPLSARPPERPSIAPSASASSWADRLRAPSPVGLPWWAVVAGGAVVVWWAVRR